MSYIIGIHTSLFKVGHSYRYGNQNNITVICVLFRSRDFKLCVMGCLEIKEEEEEEEVMLVEVIMLPVTFSSYFCHIFYPDMTRIVL